MATTAEEKTRTRTFSGRGIGRGVATGRLRFYRKSTPVGAIRRTLGAADETDRLRGAISKASDELDALYRKTFLDAGEDEAKIFEIHRMLLADDDFFSEAESLILDGYSAAYSIVEAAERYSAVFAAMADEYLAARAADLRDIASRVSGILNGNTVRTEEQRKEGDEKYIIIADDLTPSETVGLDRTKIAGFVTFSGSPNSHTAILARALGIPALIATGKIGEEYDNTTAIIDAGAGLLYIDPDSAILEKYKDTANADRSRLDALEDLRGKKTVTRSGREIKLYANIGSAAEAELALANDAEGVGLLRSEFLYLGESEYPSEEKLFRAYRETLEKMDSRPVIIRTLDIGADKKVGYFELEAEENPALGVRGVRLTLSRPGLFRRQLRAICRASAYGHASIMFPMIVSADEVKKCRRILSEVQNELDTEGIPYDHDIRVGIMIETPASAIMSEELSHEVDFFSVGTNDLIQYTLAADRQNPGVAELCDREREPVLRLIEYAARSAHAAGIWIGICGELAADTGLTQRFISAGVDELSVSPPYVLQLRAKIRECN